MNPIRPLIREAGIAFYRWALREINPLHPDVPLVVRRLQSLMDERSGDPAPGSMLASRAFWAAGAVSLLMWAGIARAAAAFWRWA